MFNFGYYVYFDGVAVYVSHARYLAKFVPIY